MGGSSKSNEKFYYKRSKHTKKDTAIAIAICQCHFGSLKKNDLSSGTGNGNNEEERE
jgi:hypothetical protein